MQRSRHCIVVHAPNSSAYVRQLSGAYTWDQLFARRRAVILAEAGSGKTREMREAAARLKHQGKVAFFVLLSELAAGSSAELRAKCSVPTLRQGRELKAAVAGLVLSLRPTDALRKRRRRGRLTAR